MKKLFVNTCNDDLEIILQLKDKVVSHKIYSLLHHNEQMLTEIDLILKQNNSQISEINEFGVVIGPGSFTGVRVGIATIKAFRDALNVKAKGVNNLLLLFALAKAKDKTIKFGAIAGSKDCYFVVRELFNKPYIYERVLSLKELKRLAGNEKIAMFKPDKDLKNSFKVEEDNLIYAKLFEESKDYSLVPVYYQLSQAERDKLAKLNVRLKVAKPEDLEEIYSLEKQNIKVNSISKTNLKQMLTSENHKAFVLKNEDKIIGFILLEITDEVNIVSLAVDADYRNLGFGSKLVKRVKKLAKDLNLNTVSLEVSENNPTAYLLYEKLGFELRRTRKHYYQDGANCLEMILKI